MTRRPRVVDNGPMALKLLQCISDDSVDLSDDLRRSRTNIRRLVAKDAERKVAIVGGVEWDWSQSASSRQQSGGVVSIGPLVRDRGVEVEF